MIECFRPNLDDKDYKNALESLESRILAFGPNVSKFEKKYKKHSNKEHNIGFNSASSAAYLLFQYLYQAYGECRVYTPSLGFVSPVFAALKNYHEVVYVDIDENLLMCPEKLMSVYIDDLKPSVVMPVLYGGVSKIDKLQKFCEEKRSILVLDSAHCISPKMDCDFSFFSFHPVKPICMSNGGLLATDNKFAADYMYRGRNFGRKLQGDSYDLVQSGFNFYMNNLNASLGLSQLKKCLQNVQKRKSNFNFLEQNMPSSLGYFTKHDEHSSYYLSTLVLKKKFSSAIMRKQLANNGVQASFHYPFLHKTEFYKHPSHLPMLNSLEDRIINLPIHQELCQKDLEKIVSECIRYSRSRSKS